MVGHCPEKSPSPHFLIDTGLITPYIEFIRRTDPAGSGPKMEISMQKVITYFADNNSMGDTSAEDCNAYRAWAKAQLAAEYPTYNVAVSDKPSLNTVTTDDDYRRDEIEQFCSNLWDRCPWDWS